MVSYERQILNMLLRGKGVEITLSRKNLGVDEDKSRVLELF